MTTDLIPKRTRRNEVSILSLAESTEELQTQIRSVYDVLLAILLRLPPSANGSALMDLMMTPPWFVSPATGNVPVPPPGFDWNRPELANFKDRITSLPREQFSALQEAAGRNAKLLAKLRDREKERAAQLNKGGHEI